MKRKGISQKSISRYLAAFIEIKAAIDADPKYHTSDIARQFKIGQHPITMLKKLGVIEQTKKGKKWVGQEPNVQMVIQIAEAIHNYHAELKSRKSAGELFKGKNKAAETPKNIEPTQSDLDMWKNRYNEQKAVKTDIPIKNEIFDQSMVSEFIQHDETPKVKHGEIESSKPKPRTFEVKIFGFRLFTINY
jgi:hypothetical protein